MQAQDIISSLYNGSISIGSLDELKKYKKHDTILILGNGPGIIDNWHVIQDSIGHTDISGTSALALTNLPINYYWTEPDFFLQRNLSDRVNSSQELARQEAYVIISHEWMSAAEVSGQCELILPNPQYPPNNYGYHRSIQTGNIVIPPWFFIDESSNHAIRNGLNCYFRINSRRPILNFRCSIIRQLSLAFELGYKNINVYGLEPSRKEYWWTLDHEDVSKLIDGCTFNRLRQPLALFNKAVTLCNEANSGEQANLFQNKISELFDFNSSIFIVLNKYLAINNDVLCNVYTNDPLVSEIASVYNLFKHKGFQLLQSS